MLQDGAHGGRLSCVSPRQPKCSVRSRPTAEQVEYGVGGTGVIYEKGKSQAQGSKKHGGVYHRAFVVLSLEPWALSLGLSLGLACANPRPTGTVLR